MSLFIGVGGIGGWLLAIGAVWGGGALLNYIWNV